MTTLCLIDIFASRDLRQPPAKKPVTRPPTQDEQRMDTDFDPPPSKPETGTADTTKPDNSPPRRPS